jgi:hypothetical protein
MNHGSLQQYDEGWLCHGATCHTRALCASRQQIMKDITFTSPRIMGSCQSSSTTTPMYTSALRQFSSSPAKRLQRRLLRKCDFRRRRRCATATTTDWSAGRSAHRRRGNNNSYYLQVDLETTIRPDDTSIHGKVFFRAFLLYDKRHHLSGRLRCIYEQLLENNNNNKPAFSSPHFYDGWSCRPNNALAKIIGKG